MPPILRYKQPANDRSLPRSAFVLPGDPLAPGRTVHFHDPLQRYAVGCEASGDADLQIEAFPWVELGIVEAGELHLRGDGFDLHMRAGDCFVVPRGIRVHWLQRGPVRRLFMAFPGLAAPADMPTRPIRIDPAQALPPSNPPSAEVLLTPTPKAWSETLFSAGDLRIGLWQCEAYSRRLVEPGYSELMYILDGTLTLTAQSGERHSVGSGETLFVPSGATNAWSSEQMVRKVFCILS